MSRAFGPAEYGRGFGPDIDPDDALVIESDAPETEEPAPKKKRKSSTSPTQRTLAECKKRGWTAGVVERWIPRVKKRIDLFGVIDLMAIVPGETGLVVGGILGIQACRDGDHATHRTKILAEPKALEWIKAGGRLELWSWGKRGDRGKRKLWTLRVEAFTVEDWSKS